MKKSKITKLLSMVLSISMLLPATTVMAQPFSTEGIKSPIADSVYNISEDLSFDMNDLQVPEEEMTLNIENDYLSPESEDTGLVPPTEGRMSIRTLSSPQPLSAEPTQEDILVGKQKQKMDAVITKLETATINGDKTAHTKAFTELSEIEISAIKALPSKSAEFSEYATNLRQGITAIKNFNDAVVKPATKETGNLISSATKSTNLNTPVKNYMKSYLAYQFPEAYLTNTVKVNREQKPGQASFDVLALAKADVEAWLAGDIVALNDFSELYLTFEKAEVKYVETGEGNIPGPVDPTNPVTPGEGNDNWTDEELKTVTEADKTVANKFREGLSIGFKNGTPVVNVPNLPKGYASRIIVKDKATNKTLADKNTTGGVIELDNVHSTTEIILGYQVYKFRGKEVGAVIVNDVLNLVIKDETKPVLQYAYTISSGEVHSLILNITDESGLDKTNPIYYRTDNYSEFKPLEANYGYGIDYGYNGRDDNYNHNFDDLFLKERYNPYKRLEKDDYRIELKEIPATLQIVAIDNFGNKLSIPMEVKDNNKKIYGNTPKYVDDLIKSAGTSNTTTAPNRKYEDLAVVAKNSTVNLFDTFRRNIEKEFRRFNSFDLVYSDAEGKTFDSEKVKFGDLGLHEIHITSRRDFGEVIVYVNVVEKNVNSNNYKIAKEAKVEKMKFKPSVAVEMPAKQKAPANLIAIIDKKYVPIEDEIEFKADKSDIKATILDVERGKDYDVVYKYVGKEEPLNPPKPEEGNNGNTNTGNVFVPTDIKGHWAQNSIQAMINQGIMAGYPDGTFAPNNMITVRETLAIAGRTAGKHPNNARAAKTSGRTVEGWSKEDIEYSLNRLPQDIFGGNYDRAATRGETSYILNNVLEFEQKGRGRNLTDLNGYAYAKDVNELVGAGVIAGFPDGTFRPNLQITRAEIASMLANAPLK